MIFKTRFFLPFCLLVSLSGSLRAQDFNGGGATAQTAARADIYLPTPENALDALALNPAGLAVLTAPVANLTAGGSFARGSFTNAANQDSPMRFTAGIVPAAAFGSPVGHSRWSIGVGVAPDLLSASKWRYRDSPGVAGANYGLQNETSAITGIRGMAGVAYSVSPNLSLGATVGAVYNSNTLDAPYIFQSNPALQGLKTLLDLHTHGVGWNSSYGLVAHPFRRIAFGAAYRTATSITSRGLATGNMGAQFSALGIPFQPDFAYRARVKVRLPPSVLVNGLWQASANWRLSLQGDWTGWHSAFHDLPVSLTAGSNTQINQFLGSNALKDAIPLDWKDQFSARGAVERALGESFSLSAGFLHSNNPVPGSTLSPLTAAIMQNGLTTGVGYRRGRLQFNASYGVDLNATSRVGTSALLSGEYNNSQVRIGTQTVMLTTSFKL